MANGTEELKNILMTRRPVEWAMLPDIEFYMDQVISFMTRQHIGLEDGELLTPAMVNNYIKHGLLPRAKGKKYAREHIVYLTAICLLKQVLSITDTGLLLKHQMKGEDPSEFYEKYRRILDEALSAVADSLTPPEDEQALASEILRLAVSSYAQKLACQRLMELLPKEEKEKGKK